MAFEHIKTQVLLIHSEQSTLDLLSAGFDNRYSVHCATSGTEALNTLGDTPIHVLVSAQDLPGMSGLDALREARKRSPDTIGILLAGTDKEDGLEALVGDQEVFQIVRGSISPEALLKLVESATQRVRLATLAESANDQAANVDSPVTEHIVMETLENGTAVISDGTGTLPALQPHKIEIAARAGSRAVDLLVMTRDEEFLATIIDSARGLHHLHHALTAKQAKDYARDNKIGVLVTDAAMVGSDVEAVIQKLRSEIPRMVAIVAGRRDDGEMLMDLINRGHVYRFLLKPVSPGRARLAIEASVKHHLEAPDSAFKPKSKAATTLLKSATKPKPVARKKPKSAPVIKAKPKPKPKPKRAPPPKARKKKTAAIRIAPTISVSPVDDSLDDAFDDESSFTATVTGMAASVGKTLSVAGSLAGDAQDAAQASGKAVAGAISSALAHVLNPKTLGIAGGSIAVVALVAWVLGSWDSSPAAVAPPRPQFVPTIIESEITFATPVREPQIEPEAEAVPEIPAYQPLLDQARAARDAGNLIEPAGDNAVDLYLATLEEAAQDLLIQAELDNVISQVLGLAETAILAQSPGDARDALSMVRLADPDNPRLAFLDAQLMQLRLRATVDAAHLAIRDGLFEDAGKLISEARSLAAVESAEVNLLSQELSAARIQQQVEEILTTANTQLEAGKLISPANDNARYYYQLADSRDPGNQAAQQGLAVVAGKLVLQAVEAINDGRLDDARDLLSNARTLDSSSSELAASTKMLDTALEAKAEAVRQAEAARVAELERQAELQRQAEATRQAELERQAERERQAEIERQAELDRQAEEARLAEIERQAAEERQEIAREAQRQASERDAAAAATASVLGVAGSTVKDASSNSVPGIAAPGSIDNRSVQTSNDALLEVETLPAAAPPSTAGAVGGAATFATGDNTNSSTLNTGTGQAAIAAGSPQSFSTGNNGADPFAGGSSNDAAADVPVPISSLTRTNYVAPVYPRSAQRRNVSGSVDIMFTVSAQGIVTDISVLRAEPGETFHQAAIDAVTQWRFEPVIENGVAVDKRTAVRLSFNLQ